MDIYRDLFENNNTIMLIIDPDNGMIFDANQAALEFYGYSREEIKKLRIQQINILSPSQVEVEMNAALKNKKNYFIFKHRLNNGEIKTVEVYSGPLVLKNDNDIKKTYLFSTVFDVTEKFKVIQELNQLKHILSICANCKRIKTEYGTWIEPEEFLSDKMDIKFSSGLCPNCAKLYIQQMQESQ